MRQARNRWVKVGVDEGNQDIQICILTLVRNNGPREFGWLQRVLVESNGSILILKKLSSG